MMVLRRALLAIIAGLLCGCAATPASLGPATGTVTGHVMVRACGGAYRLDQNGCRVGPAEGAQVTFVLAGSTARATASTDASGAYRLSLKPGTYGVQVEQQGMPSPVPAGGSFGSSHGYAGPSQVTVAAGRTVTADFTETIELL
jgi:carboxypeptidase family protein